MRDAEAPSSTSQPSGTLAAGKSEEGSVAKKGWIRAVENSLLLLVVLRCEGGGEMS